MREVILGVGCFGHDSSACVVERESGNVLFAIAEERLSNIKHDWRFPIGAVTKCQEFIHGNDYFFESVAINFEDFEFTSGTLFSEIDLILQDKTSAKKLKDSIELVYPFADYFSFNGSFSKTYLSRVLDGLSLSSEIRNSLEARIFWYFNWSVKYKNIAEAVSTLFTGKTIHKINHHLCHAASAYYNSGFEEATVLTIDGQGESETIGVYKCGSKGIEKISSTTWPFSLGIFYLNVTNYLGFNIGDEYKVMGMAAYGKPRFLDSLREMISVDPSSRIIFNETNYFAKMPVSGLYGHFYFNFTRNFGSLVAKRTKSEEIRQEHFDLATSVQKLTEEIGVALVRNAVKMTGCTNVALAGGVALNGLMNEQIRRHSGISNIFIYPASGDDGTSIGAAQFVAFKDRKAVSKKIHTPFYGSSYSNSDIEKVLSEKGMIYSRPENIHEAIAKAISQDRIVARFYGRSEYGPRALGNRSILGNPMNPEMKEILNRRIKHREPFRPFAPACMVEHASEYFDIDIDSPFMLLITTAKPLAQKKIPAVVHHDNTARVQTISPDQNPNFYNTISEFKKITGIPVLINTSFNVNGEAIVETPLDALESFAHMDIDYLAIGDYFISKQENAGKFEDLPDEKFLQKRKSRYEQAVTHPLKDFNIDSFYFKEGLKLSEGSAKNNGNGFVGKVIFRLKNLLNR